MGQWIRSKVLDVIDPGWRDGPLMSKVLADQDRIRNDPKIQAIREQVQRESVRGARLASAGLLLVPLAGWLIYAVLTGVPLTAALNDIAARLYAIWAACVAMVHLLTTAGRR